MKTSVRRPAAKSRRTLFEFIDQQFGAHWRCELVNFGKWGLEARWYRNSEFHRGRKFTGSDDDSSIAVGRAIEWATTERERLENDGA